MSLDIKVPLIVRREAYYEFGGGEPVTRAGPRVRAVPRPILPSFYCFYLLSVQGLNSGRHLAYLHHQVHSNPFPVKDSHRWPAV